MKKTQQIKIFPKKNLSFKLIKNQIDNLTLEPVSSLGMRLGFISLGISIMVLVWYWLRLPPEVPLFFSKPYGESQLASCLFLLILPVSTLVIQIFCLGWAGKALAKDRLLSQLLVWIESLFSLMNLISLIKIISLVI